MLIRGSTDEVDGGGFTGPFLGEEAKILPSVLHSSLDDLRSLHQAPYTWFGRTHARTGAWVPYQRSKGGLGPVLSQVV